jgi:hypothetical protein
MVGCGSGAPGDGEGSGAFGGGATTIPTLHAPGGFAEPFGPSNGIGPSLPDVETSADPGDPLPVNVTLKFEFNCKEPIASLCSVNCTRLDLFGLLFPPEVSFPTDDPGPPKDPIDDSPSIIDAINDQCAFRICPFRTGIPMDLPPIDQYEGEIECTTADDPFGEYDVCTFYQSDEQFCKDFANP